MRIESGNHLIVNLGSCNCVITIVCRTVQYYLYVLHSFLTHPDLMFNQIMVLYINTRIMDINAESGCYHLHHIALFG